MKKIFVTGGAGFIGRNLIRNLIKISEFQVTSIDNNYRWSNDEFAKNGIDENNLKIINGDICNKELINELINENDIIIHLAGISQVITSINNPDLTFEYNVIGTKNIVDFCTKYKKKLIFSSSREVYGTAKYMPIDLLHPLNQENPYGASKIIGESLIKSYSNSFGLEYIIFRFANVYGQGDKGRVIPIFIDKMKNNEDITIYGNDKIIDFVYIDDIVQAIYKVILRDDIVNETFNLGTGVECTLQELAKKLLNITGSNSKLIFENNRKGEVDKFCADISYTKEKLDWNPEIDLKLGLNNTINGINTK
ncbi:MAG: GDP-mannose 4,6-dehydratase [Candidatus Gracilibacteria bacterium]|nr:GDP-mannose 4,6-dehydratase [Candidatus Gracilibacteria bacterium]MDD2908655.1 GDP-mannose 4,6-dehydratase [Candidatus Gracilibacteria bacterium]